LTGLSHGAFAMTMTLATPTQMVGNKLTNRTPVLCPVCDLYVATFTGLPVILNAKNRIIEFAHAGCCARQEQT
jgi:hypothetical protein